MKRSVTLRFRCTPAEAEEIRRLADGNVSALVRRAVLGSEDGLHRANGEPSGTGRAGSLSSDPRPELVRRLMERSTRG